MKTLRTSFILILILFSIRTQGQLVVNAGNDTIICVEMWGVDTTEIGGNPAAIGGTEPYSYTWTTNYTIGLYTYGASYFLDDSTLSNPKIVNDAPDNLKFKLTVRDNIGTQNEDSITVRFSRFAYTLEDYFANINQGDTVSLMHNIGLGIEPLSYVWTPDYNISDPSISNPKVWPDSSVNYQVIAIDSIGCVSEPDIFEIYVNPLGILMPEKIRCQSTIFPNPVDNNSVIFFDAAQKDKLTIKIINTKGQVIFSDKFSNNSYKIGNIITTSGLYIYVISNNTEVLTSGQFVKK
jgi:Secretion system C-terminal sorting domain